MTKHHAVTLDLSGGRYTGDYQLHTFDSEQERNAYVKGVSDTLDSIAYLNPPDKLSGWHAIVEYENLPWSTPLGLVARIAKEVENG